VSAAVDLPAEIDGKGINGYTKITNCPLKGQSGGNPQRAIFSMFPNLCLSMVHSVIFNETIQLGFPNTILQR